MLTTEVKAALEGTIGTNVRVSKTVGVEFLISQSRSDKVIRLAFPLSSIQGHIAQIRQTLLPCNCAGPGAGSLIALA